MSFVCGEVFRCLQSSFSSLSFNLLLSSKVTLQTHVMSGHRRLTIAVIACVDNIIWLNHHSSHVVRCTEYLPSLRTSVLAGVMLWCLRCSGVVVASVWVTIAVISDNCWFLRKSESWVSRVALYCDSLTHTVPLVIHSVIFVCWDRQNPTTNNQPTERTEAIIILSFPLIYPAATQPRQNDQQLWQWWQWW